MADVIELKIIDGGKKHGERGPMLIVCHCGQSIYQVLSNNTVRCYRCGCVPPLSWKWNQRSEGEDGPQRA